MSAEAQVKTLAPDTAMPYHACGLYLHRTAGIHPVCGRLPGRCRTGRFAADPGSQPGGWRLGGWHPRRAQAALVKRQPGESGGVRVIYYFHSEGVPLYLLTLFAKNERANLSKAERNELAELVGLLVAAWQEE